MLDIKYVRDHVSEVKQNVKNRKAKVDIDDLLIRDDRRKELQTQLDSNRQILNASSKSKPTPEKIAELRTLSELIKLQETELKKAQEAFDDVWSWMPNDSSPDMPIGKGEADNVEIKVWIPEQGYLSQEKLGKGENSRQYMPKIDNAIHHVEIGEALDIIDTKQSSLTSGSRFVYLKNEAVVLEYALFDLLSKKLLSEGFTPIIPPLMVREKVLFGTSHFPEGRDQVYQIANENVEENMELFLIGSAEPALFAYWMDKTVTRKESPAKMFALTPCFRSEVGSWGKDVRGMKRVHQFDKLEMDVVCLPEQAHDVFDQLLSINEWLLQSLKIPYRVINKCTGDCGYLATYKQYDVEVWLSGQQEFMETMTDTNATDYQARRLNIRYQSGDDKGYAYTVNDTGAAMGRLIIAILDTYQQADGSVKIPDVLQLYMGKDIISAK